MRAIVFAILIALVGCSPGKFPETLLTETERGLVRAAVDDVARGDAARLSSKVEPSIAAQIGDAMPAMQQALPRPPLELTPLNANVSLTGDVRVAEAVYQVKGKSGWALVEARMQTANGSSRLAGFFVQSVQTEPRRLNAFRLSDAGAAAMLAAVAVTIAGVVRIWRSGLFARRWLWTLGALVGLTTLKMNWSTGEVAFHPVSFQIFSFSAFKQPLFEPWTLGVSLPLVALIALLKRRRQTREDASADG